MEGYPIVIDGVELSEQEAWKYFALKKWYEQKAAIKVSDALFINWLLVSGEIVEVINFGKLG